MTHQIEAQNILDMIEMLFNTYMQLGSQKTEWSVKEYR